VDRRKPPAIDACRKPAVDAPSPQSNSGWPTRAWHRSGLRRRFEPSPHCRMTPQPGRSCLNPWTPGRGPAYATRAGKRPASSAGDSRSSWRHGAGPLASRN